MISAVFRQARRNLNIAGILVGLTNRLIILAGFFLYYFSKYGQHHTQYLKDTIVTVLLMLIGFVLANITFNIPQNSGLYDLEISLDVLEHDNDNSLKLVLKRRRRSMAITIAL
jgi:hypothetical protein